jgi:tetratricopeptide (TPR) repeat protein
VTKRFDSLWRSCVVLNVTSYCSRISHYGVFSLTNAAIGLDLKIKGISTLDVVNLVNEKLGLARNAVQNGDYQKAFSLFSEIQKIQPHHADVYFHFGAALLDVEEFDTAIQQLTQACQMLPQEHAPLFKLAEAFEAVNSIADVQTVMSFALKQFPNNPEVLYRAANFYREVGQLKKADDLASQCITYSQDLLLQAHAWLLKLNLGQMKRLEDAHLALVSISQATSNNDEHVQIAKMIVHFALGRYFELTKSPTKAFEHWKVANKVQISACDYRVKQLAPLFEAIKANSRHGVPDQQQSIGFTPIFILGLPRTGSTLLEQSLCRHSSVSSLGEQPIIASQVVNFLSHNLNEAYPLFMSKLDSDKGIELRKQAAKLYENAVLKRQLNSPFVIDKLPANFQSIGLIQALFPHAKIIHLSRHFEDTALSIFKNHFAVNEPYMCDLKELSNYHALYQDLMQHWHQTFPEKIYELRYEALVEHPQALLEDVLTYCGLEHEKQCWEEQANDGANEQAPARLVKTLSSAQVIEPIHQGAVGRHIEYAALLHQNGLQV